MSNNLTTIQFDPHHYPINRFIIAGWTGRNRASVESHIHELECLGVDPPKNIPSFYRIAKSRVTSDRVIEVRGENTSGEVEFVISMSTAGVLIGVGSDHTDRNLEVIDVAQSKEVCEKIIAPILWKYSDIQDHWDQLILRSYIYENNKRILYQENTLDMLLNVDSLINEMNITTGSHIQDYDLIMGGTLDTFGGIRGSDVFEFELEDPVLSRIIKHGYSVVVI